MNFKVLISAILASTIAIVGCESDSGGSGGGAGGTGGTPEPRDCTGLASTGMYSVEGAPPTPIDDCTTTVNPSGGDDTAALTDALEGAGSDAVICLGTGTFDVRETLFVSAALRITLKGRGESPDDVVLDYANALDGDGIEATTAGFTIENLWIKNTVKDSVVVRADDATFRKVFVTWDTGSVLENGKYGIFPRNANNVLIEYSEVIGASDAGIYVGQCIGGIIKNNKASGNVAGIEIENSQDVEVYDNEAYDNTAGILAFQLPGLSLDGDNVLMRDNDMYCNNRANFAAEGSIVSFVPAGTGALIAAGQRFELRNNVIDGNASVGVLIASQVLLCQLGEERPDCLTGWPDGFDPYPTQMFLNGNTFINNGLDPQETIGLIAELALMVDTLETVQWDGYIDPAVTDPEICLGETDVPSFRDYSNNQCGAAAGLLEVGDCFGMNSNTSTEGHLCTLPELVIP